MESAVVVNTMPMLRAGELSKIVDKAEVTLALCEPAERLERVLLSPASSSPQVTDCGNWVLRNYPSDVLEAKAAAAVAFTDLFLGLGAVALIVGGFGIANVMLMSVMERRGEIGLRRALGATRRHIALQFVSEALALALVGGVLGVLLGAGLAVAYALSQAWAPIIPAVAVVGGIAAAVAIGALAGFYPAMRAARLSPTDALRGSE